MRLEFSKTDRWSLLLLIVAILLYAVLFFEPMWGFYLYSPQYPQGLTLSVYLNRVGGDVTEVNILNHYIGMAKLDEAAQLEKKLAVYGIALIALTAFASGFAERRYARLLSLPSIVFPVAFLFILHLWMYRFGHDLSPHAPVHIRTFTPTLIGEGRIGNFHTMGLPGVGFYLALVAAACVVMALLRNRLSSPVNSSGYTTLGSAEVKNGFMRHRRIK